MAQITRRTFLRGAAATAGAAALGGPFLGFQPPSLDPPDLIFHHGRILTMAAPKTAAEAIAIASGTVVAVGSNREIQALRGPRTVAVNLQGRALLPGFVDAHSHRLGDWSLRYASPEAAVQDAVATGWTTISELFASQDRLDLLTELDVAGHLPIDVNAYLPINYGFDRFGDWYLAYDPDQQLSPHVRVAGIKVFIDSGAQDEKLLSEPYANHPDHYGTGFWDQPDLDVAVRAAHDAGFQVAAHTGGDAAHDLIISALAAALGGAPNAPRHRVEHVMIAGMTRSRGWRTSDSLPQSSFPSSIPTGRRSSRPDSARIAWRGSDDGGTFWMAACRRLAPRTSPTATARQALRCWRSIKP
jgi:hypothetical protein